MTFRIETLGCKANQYDSQRLAGALVRLGWREAQGNEQPDAVIINTCTVTATCARKCRQAAGQMARRYPGAAIFVTGCHATAFPDDLRGVEGVRGVYGRGRWRQMLREITGSSELPAGLLEGDFGIQGFSGRARALLKIQEGCGSFCAYCIVPLVRGRPRSRPLGDVKAEAERLARAGFREIVLTGIHLGHYGRDLAGQVSLADAVLAVRDTEGIERVRLSSIKADEVDERLLAAMQHPAPAPAASERGRRGPEAHEARLHRLAVPRNR